jgi:hypothetical protein
LLAAHGREALQSLPGPEAFAGRDGQLGVG